MSPEEAKQYEETSCALVARGSEQWDAVGTVQAVIVVVHEAGIAAAIFERAAVRADTESRMRTRMKAKKTLEAFSRSYKESDLDQFDSDFCKLAEDFPALRADFVKRHAALFVS